MINIDKSLGPYGLNARFYKDHWSKIGKGEIKFDQSFFERGELDHVINHTHICMIPKTMPRRPYSETMSRQYLVIDQLLSFSGQGVFADW